MRTHRVSLEIDDREETAEGAPVNPPPHHLKTFRAIYAAFARIHYDERHPQYFEAREYCRREIAGSEPTRDEFLAWVLSSAAEQGNTPVGIGYVHIKGPRDPFPLDDSSAFVVQVPLRFNVSEG